LLPINEEDETEDPSCESFDYYKVGNTGVQVPGVNGVWDVVTKWGKCPGIGVAASYQTYYFHLPAYWNPNYAAAFSICRNGFRSNLAVKLIRVYLH